MNMMTEKKILVLSAGGPAGVNFLKAINLARYYEIYAADVNPYHLVNAEPHVVKTFKIPKYTSPDYIDEINKIIEKYDIDFVHAQSDPEVRRIANARYRIKALTFLPSTVTIFRCQDKYLTAFIWSQVWKDTTPYFVDTNAAFHRIKDPLSKDKLWIRATHGAGGKASSLITDQNIAEHWMWYWWNIDPQINFLFQKYLPGRNIAWQGVYKNGILITSQARERVEYIYPNLTPSGITGTPSVQRTINENKVNGNAEAAVKMIDNKPNGVFGVDLKENEDGDPIPTEINAGRFFTTSYFFPYAGAIYDCPRANMPEIYLRLAFNEKIPEGKFRNVLPEDLYWIRHMDCPAQLEKGDTIWHLK